MKKHFSVRFFLQIIQPKSIPVIIVNFNQLDTLEILINFLTERKFTNINIIDNNSTYEPLFEYYEKIKNKVNIIALKNNDGHMVLFNNKSLYDQLCNGMFILTDPDIIPNKNLPKNFMGTLIKNLLIYEEWVTKAGFALDISNIPAYYLAKQKVIEWEKRFWKNEVEKDIFLTTLDTTFALYKPRTFEKYKQDNDHFRALRIAGDFTCDHMGWHIDYDNLTEEQKFYIAQASNSSSWLIDDSGNTKDTTY